MRAQKQMHMLLRKKHEINILKFGGESRFDAGAHTSLSARQNVKLWKN